MSEELRSDLVYLRYMETSPQNILDDCTRKLKFLTLYKKTIISDLTRNLTHMSRRRIIYWVYEVTRFFEQLINDPGYKNNSIPFYNLSYSSIIAGLSTRLRIQDFKHRYNGILKYSNDNLSFIARLYWPCKWEFPEDSDFLHILKIAHP